jgi:serine/threonine-protein kinase
MRDQETMPMGAANGATAVVRGPQGAQTRAIPAAVGDAQRRQRSNWMLAVLSVLGVLAVIALVAGLLVQRARGEKVEVDSVLGQPVAAAQQALTAKGFTVETTPREDPDCRENTVIEQNPQGGSRAAKQSTVTLTVCAGPGTVSVPNLEGQTREAAERELERLNLKPDFDAVDSSLPKDQVIKVDKAGSSVKPGTTIKVQISNNELVKVPNVVGKSREVAEALLSNAGFDVKVEDGQRVQNENLADKVLEQSPGRDKEAKRDSTVTITVTVFEEPDGEPSGDPTTPPPGGNNGGIGDILPGIGGGGRPVIGADRAHQN